MSTVQQGLAEDHFHIPGFFKEKGQLCDTCGLPFGELRDTSKGFWIEPASGCCKSFDANRPGPGTCGGTLAGPFSTRLDAEIAATALDWFEGEHNRGWHVIAPRQAG
jgi:hypothetical protein